MSTALRWRIMALQAILVLVLGFVAGFLFWANNFATGYVHDQLVAQQIYFPPASEIKAGGALDPAEFPASITQYAGQQVDNGDKAKEYANNFIGKHLEKVANGQTYSQVSTNAIALQSQIANTPKTDPNYASMQTQLTTLNGQKTTLFQGETLRGLLLNAWGWSQIGLYAGYAAWAMTAAAAVVAVAFLFELLVAIFGVRNETEAVAVKRTTA